MTSHARAIVFPAISRVEVRSVELPRQEAWDVTVELAASAVSLGTERWALLGKRPPGDVTFPCIPGYLSVGRIVDLGAAARNAYAMGERINFLAAQIPAGHEGNWMCGHLSPAVVRMDPEILLGSDIGMPYAETVPGNLPAEEAALAGLAAVACRGIDMAEIAADQSVVVVGQGMIGHAAAQICRLKGARVLTADTMAARVELSRQWAADVAVNSREEDLAERIAEFTGGRGADVIIDTTGSAAMIGQEVECLRRFGKLVLQGWYPPPSALDLHRMQLKFVQAFFPCGHSGRAVARCMRWAEQGMLRLRPLITHRFQPEQAPAAYDLVVNRPDETMAIIFQWQDA